MSPVNSVYLTEVERVDVVGRRRTGSVQRRFDIRLRERTGKYPAAFAKFATENHDRLYITNFPFDGQRCLALYPTSSGKLTHIRTARDSIRV